MNPELPGGRRGEIEVSRYVDIFCDSLGLERVEGAGLPGRPNSVWLLRAPGAAAKRTLMLEAHMDTVTLENMPDGTMPRVVGGRLYGRGACDTKGSLAAMMVAVQTLATQHRGALPANVMLAAVVGEEVGQRGARALIDAGVRAEGAVVGEPTSLRPVIAHKGVARFQISTRGRSAHTARPEEGDNAIVQMVAVIRHLEEVLGPGLKAQSHPLCGHPVQTIAMASGGRQYNLVPDECRIFVDRRTLPDEDPVAVLEAYRAALAELVSRTPGLRAEVVSVDSLSPGLDTPPDSPIVTAARKASEQVTGDGTPLGAPYGSDASTYWGVGRIPSVLLGPGDIAQAHTADEWIELRQLEAAVEVYVQLALAF